MDFQSANPLNVQFNLLSGNLLPVTSHDSSFSLFWKIYSIITWIVDIILMIATIIGCIYLPIEKMIEGDMIVLAEVMDGIIFFLQTFFMVLQIHSQKNVIYQFIQKLNEMLYITDETMKNVITMILQPVKYPIKFYWTTGLAVTVLWDLLPFLIMLEKDVFRYEDFIIPVALSKQPFSSTIFALGSLFILIASFYTVCKKIGVDLYMMHLILMTTAQYKYIAVKLAKVCQEEKNSNEFKENNSEKVNRKKELEIKALCQRHRDVVYIGSLVKTLLSSNCTSIYLISVFRLCFLGIAVSNLTEVSFLILLSIATFLLSVTVQLYMLCSCIQQLADASTEVTDEAFNESWYLLSPWAKRLFLLTIIADNLECKISTNEKFNLSLPGFMNILNQSYSISLLFLKMKEK